MSSAELTVGSLFAGVGGFDIAAERAGMEVAWQSEVDRHACAVLAHHWPNVPNHGDVRDIQIGRYPDAAAVDVLTGGFPCQDYSIAGSRSGLAGDRGALWWDYHRLIAEGRPTWVVGENVAGLLSSRGGADFATIVDSLTECGYGVAWAVLDAQYFGVPQRRRRVFIVGHSGGRPRPEILALGEGVFGHPEPSRGAGAPVAALTTSGVGGGGGPDDNAAQARHLIAVHAKQTPVHETEMSPTLSSTGMIAFAQNQRDEVRDLGDTAGALGADVGIKQQTFVASPQVRRLTPTECERLQGFPDGWTAIDGNSDTQRYRQMGNAVAVPVVEWILRRIAASEQEGGGA